MDNENFKQMLADAELSRSKLADILNIKVGSVNNWGSTQNIPYWVESWLNNYIEKRKFEKVKQTLKDTGVCDG